jgi:hypothetical protein
MAGAKKRTRKLLEIERCWEHSRLQGQLIAAVYELVTPLIRRPLSSPATRPARTRSGGAGQSQPRTEGNHA